MIVWSKALLLLEGNPPKFSTHRAVRVLISGYLATAVEPAAVQSRKNAVAHN